jgi:hypothetical protein
LFLAFLEQACGSVSTSSGGFPADPDEVDPPPGPYIATLTPTGVSPQVLHVWRTRTGILVNADGRVRALAADPHAGHHECGGALNLTLKPGERREIRSLPINACFFHDEADPLNRNFQGVVVIH